jgi:hypothetical protein
MLSPHCVGEYPPFWHFGWRTSVAEDLGTPGLGELSALVRDLKERSWTGLEKI